MMNERLFDYDDLSLIQNERIVKKEIYPKEEIFQDALFYFRNNGFPFPNITIHEAKQKLNLLASLELKDCINSLLCGDVADTFHKHRFYGHAIGKKSPVMAFEIDKDLLKVFKYTYPNIGTKYMGFLSLVSNTQANSNFRPAFVKYILHKYGVDFDFYLDPCMGYGGRLVGFLASDFNMYIGTDPSVKSYKANKAIIKALGNKKKFDIYNETFEDLDLINYYNKVDIVFTSPPYFMKEIYSTDNTQSMIKFSSYDKWLEGFLKILIKKSYDCLKNNRYFILNIENVTIKGRLYPLVIDSVRLAKETGFKFIKKDPYPLIGTTCGANVQNIKIPNESLLIFKKE